MLHNYDGTNLPTSIASSVNTADQRLLDAKHQVQKCCWASCWLQRVSHDSLETLTQAEHKIKRRLLRRNERCKVQSCSCQA